MDATHLWIRAETRPTEERAPIVPADAFYEWKAIPGAGKQPYRIGMRSGAPFAVYEAAVWPLRAGRECKVRL